MDKTPHEETAAWLAAWHHAGGEYTINAFSLNGQRSPVGRVFSDHEEAARYAHILDDMGYEGIYFRTTTLRPGTVFKPGGRGLADDSAVMVGYAFDLDRHWSGRKEEGKGGPMPDTLEQWEAVRIAAGLPPFTIIVESGGGFYGMYLFIVSLDVSTELGLARGKAFAENAHALLKAWAVEAGWFTLDSTTDLARVFGLPGTINRKPENGEPSRRHVIKDDGPRYTIEEIEAVIAAAAWPGKPKLTPEFSAADDDFDFGPGWADSALGGAFEPERRTPSKQHDWEWYQREHLGPKTEAVRNSTGGFNNALNDLALAVGHGIGTAFPYDQAMLQLENVVTEVWENGPNHEDRSTIQSGLSKGMAEPWDITGSPWRLAIEAAERTAIAVDSADALIAEMLTLDEMELKPPPKFMIQKLLQFDSESWIIGPPGSKKSFVVFDMAARVIRGDDWQGLRTNPADVVMIVGEGSSGVGKRAKAWRQRYGAIEKAGGRHFYTLPRPVQAKDRTAWATLVEACRKISALAAAEGRGLLVILDTQARVTAGMKENDNGDMNEFTRAVGDIRQASGACVLTVHHTGRAGGDARGASVIDGAQTTELKVIAKGKLSGVLSVEKQKDIDEREPMNLAFEVIDLGWDPDGDAVNSLVLCEPGSAEFAAAWEAAEASPEADAIEAEKKVTPFKARGQSIDSWIVERMPRAALQHWIVQALVDTAETLGLTQPEIKGLVEEKRPGVDKSTFKRAWQVVTETDGAWSDVVIQAGGQRWTVDRVALAALQNPVTDE